MAPAVQGGDRFVEVEAGFGRDSPGRRENDAGGLARLQLEHPAAEGMPFQFAAQRTNGDGQPSLIRRAAPWRRTRTPCTAFVQTAAAALRTRLGARPDM